jgi:hypothetical protein
MNIVSTPKLNTSEYQALRTQQLHTAAPLLSYAASKHTLRLVWILLMFTIKHLRMQMRYNMFSYFKWVRVRQNAQPRTVLLHFFFEFCKVFALAAFNGGNCLTQTDKTFTGLTNYTFSSYRKLGSPLTISKGPMARKKRSREQYTSFQSIAVVNFKLKINWTRIGGISITPCNTNSVSPSLGQSRALPQLFYRFEAGSRASTCYSNLLLQDIGLISFFSLYSNYRVLLTAVAHRAKGGVKYSQVFGGIFYFLYVCSFCKNKALAIDSNLAQLYVTTRRMTIFDIYFFSNL